MYIICLCTFLSATYWPSAASFWPSKGPTDPTSSCALPGSFSQSLQLPRVSAQSSLVSCSHFDGSQTKLARCLHVHQWSPMFFYSDTAPMFLKALRNGYRMCLFCLALRVAFLLLAKYICKCMANANAKARASQCSCYKEALRGERPWAGPGQQGAKATKQRKHIFAHLCSINSAKSKTCMQQSISIHFHDLFDFDRSAQDNQSFFAKIRWIYLSWSSVSHGILLSCNRVRGHFAFVGYWNTMTQVQILLGPRDALEAFQHLI